MDEESSVREGVWEKDTLSLYRGNCTTSCHRPLQWIIIILFVFWVNLKKRTHNQVPGPFSANERRQFCQHTSVMRGSIRIMSQEYGRMVGWPVSTSINHSVALLIGRLKVNESIIDIYLWIKLKLRVRRLHTKQTFLHIREYPDTNVGMRKDRE